ncbi:unnamed protein product [Cylindrotheca closterium]|uniref:DUF885 domain-containing protein n=1 Tax=Cylindrotheca closterium TaxID=2856 RepID=A0AAD2G1N9_9STRA|nr:unnamed protein product [Cylindrotheca closterium]
MTTSELLEKEYASTWQWRIDTDPELAAAMGMLNRRRSTHAIDPRSLSSYQQRLDWVKRALLRVESISTEGLTKSELLTRRLYIEQLSDYAKYSEKHEAYLCCINRLEGPQTDLPLYAQYLPIKTQTQREFYMSFLSAIPQQLGEIQELLKYGLEKKRTPPQISLGGVVEQIRSMTTAGLQPFKQPLMVKDDKGNDLFEPDMKKSCLELIDGGATDAFTSLADFLEGEYIPNLRTEISAAKGYPDGEQYYIDCLNFHTTTGMTPQEVHDLGLQEVARVRSGMETVKKEDGFENLQLEEYLTYLRTSPIFEPASAESLLASYRDIVGQLYPKLLRLFHLDTLPRQPLDVTESPAASAHMAPAAYYLAGSTDSKAPRPGVFYVNTSELSTRRTYESQALTLHEGIPGHHLQGAIQGESTGMPEFLRFVEDRQYFSAPARFPFYTGYIEGWGLHSETLGHELGLYKKPTDKFGQLSMEAIRSCRLVVDTGMHALGWSQEQAVQYMLQNTAMGEHDARTEVARYVTWPGQATAYKVGERFIRRMRTMAETELLDAFDPRDFYDVVLKCGAVPLFVLEDLVKEYILETSKTGNVRETTSPAGSTEKQTVDDFAATMTFANWCKCCIVPGSCQP